MSFCKVGSDTYCTRYGRYSCSCSCFMSLSSCHVMSVVGRLVTGQYRVMRTCVRLISLAGAEINSKRIVFIFPHTDHGSFTDHTRIALSLDARYSATASARPAAISQKSSLGKSRSQRLQRTATAHWSSGHTLCTTSLYTPYTVHTSATIPAIISQRILSIFQSSPHILIPLLCSSLLPA